MVKGQSEFDDEKVSFYQDSAYEDLPTFAELGISMYEQDWQYYGVSYLSINKEINYIGSDRETLENASKASKRRMHFNVLTYNISYSSFEEVYINYENVTEKFENSLIEGIRSFLILNITILINAIKKCTYCNIGSNRLF